jgi:hypothetical protein
MYQRRSERVCIISPAVYTLISSGAFCRAGASLPRVLRDAGANNIAALARPQRRVAQNCAGPSCSSRWNVVLTVFLPSFCRTGGLSKKRTQLFGQRVATRSAARLCWWARHAS